MDVSENPDGEADQDVSNSDDESDFTETQKGFVGYHKW